MKRTAVIGLGSIAKRHRKNLKLLFPKGQVYAMSASGRVPNEDVCSCDFVASNIKELIDSNVEMVIIASPAPFHAIHAITLIKAGIPVIIEKPLASHSKGAQEIRDAQKLYSTPVCVGYCLRYLPSAKVMKRSLESKIIGDPFHCSIEVGQYLPDWRQGQDIRKTVSANQELGGGALLELSHELDYANWLFGDLKLEHANLRSSQDLGLSVEDCVDIVVSAERNLIVNMHLDFLQQRPHRKCRVVGSSGAIEWDLLKNEVVVMKKDQDEIIYSESTWDKNQMYINLITDFIKLIGQEESSSVTINEAAKTVVLIDSIKSRFSIKSC